MVHLNRVSFDLSNKDKVQNLKEEQLLADLSIRTRNVIEAPDGALFFSSDEGQIYRLSKVEK